MRVFVFLSFAIFGLVSATTHDNILTDDVLSDDEFKEMVDLAKHLAQWCRETGECSVDLFGEEDPDLMELLSGGEVQSRKKRAASSLRDMCHYYGMKCKRSSPRDSEIEQNEAALWNKLIRAYFNRCTIQNRCDVEDYMGEINYIMKNFHNKDMGF